MKNLELKPLPPIERKSPKPLELPEEVVKKKVQEAKIHLAPLQGRSTQQGGVELVSLLRRRPVKVQLSTTDVTRGDSSATR